MVNVVPEFSAIEDRSIARTILRLLFLVGCVLSSVCFGKGASSPPPLRSGFFRLSKFLHVMAQSSDPDFIPASEFYGNYHGHEVEFLEMLHDSMQQQSEKKVEDARRCIFLVGDSSLDNKHWLLDTRRAPDDHQQLKSDSRSGPALNGFESILRPPRMVKDFAFWMNFFAVNPESIFDPGEESPGFDFLRCSSNSGRLKLPFWCCNAAVEESTLSDRDENPAKSPARCGLKEGGLLYHDQFVRDRIAEGDYLVVSVGGNDIALRPSVGTMWNIALLMYLTSTTYIIENQSSFWSPFNSGWGGWGWPIGLAHLIKMFRYQLAAYLTKLVEKKKPKAIFVCMIYFPDESPPPGKVSWADTALNQLSYNSHPEKVQSLIRAVYRLGVEQVEVEGTRIVPVPFFEVLDGKNTGDYEARVEPSVEGGRKLARQVWKEIVKFEGKSASEAVGGSDDAEHASSSNK
uniref:Uncharacterized protein n=1 Tax=Chromera velia CCMP2878 TaxID=1169474 RepID=A0A0G4F414_9ALVE|eukprot:Cvel_15087.t1-p1 / transcript=Cvel_15087.t1 / gene=Cvel_15087 / organism=Chromera_velia_CCMP2878 / gene_product=hypothetical protein / transcript_product=hypothetical protein / location=Cvel_scaffold1100:54215-55588(-) / protein_length=458 / sequence_SO=supercontig / SO=protein_coding / is_pseudo=false